jgi:hypothetical protein
LVKRGGEVVRKVHGIVGTDCVTVDEIVESDAYHRGIGMFLYEREEMRMCLLEMGVVFSGDDNLKGEFGFHVMVDP